MKKIITVIISSVTASLLLFSCVCAFHAPQNNIAPRQEGIQLCFDDEPIWEDS